MQLSFGPPSNQYLAYVTGNPPRDLPAGTTGPVIDVKTFYEQTRARCFPGTFSLISLGAPLAAFAAAIGVIVFLLSSGMPDLLQNSAAVDEKASNPALPIGTFCGPDRGYDPLLNGVLANTFHFSVTHVALMAVCLLALVGAAISISNVVETHVLLRAGVVVKSLERILALVIPAAAGYGVFLGASFAVGNRIDGLFQRLFPAPASALEHCEILKAVKVLNEQLYVQMGRGALAVSVGVVSLILAAALLGWRFERKDINGAWSDSFVLRHKINNVLTLFFIASILLVITTIALSAATDWTSGVLDVVKAATAPDAQGAAAPATQSGASGSTGAAKPADPGGPPAPPTGAPASDQAGAAKPADPAAAEFDSLKTLKTSISTFAGALGSLLLILIFVPPLYCLTGEIEIAGKTHASFDLANKDPPPAEPPAPAPIYARGANGSFYEVEVEAGATEQAPAILSVKGMDGTPYQFELVAAPGKPPPATFLGKGVDGRIYEFGTPPAPGAAPGKIEDAAGWKVAGWKIVQDWKNNHGLKLSFSDMTGTFVAVLAPLLSGSIVDLSKMALG
jgi:hypothetical protein